MKEEGTAGSRKRRRTILETSSAPATPAPDTRKRIVVKWTLAEDKAIITLLSRGRTIQQIQQDPLFLEASPTPRTVGAIKQQLRRAAKGKASRELQHFVKSLQSQALAPSEEEKGAGVTEEEGALTPSEAEVDDIEAEIENMRANQGEGSSVARSLPFLRRNVMKSKATGSQPIIQGAELKEKTRIEQKQKNPKEQGGKYTSEMTPEERAKKDAEISRALDDIEAEIENVGIEQGEGSPVARSLPFLLHLAREVTRKKKAIGPWPIIKAADFSSDLRKKKKNMRRKQNPEEQGGWKIKVSELTPKKRKKLEEAALARGPGLKGKVSLALQLWPHIFNLRLTSLSVFLSLSLRALDATDAAG